MLHPLRRGGGHDLRASSSSANKTINVIDEGGVAIGVQSFHSTLGGAKPVIVGVAVTPIDAAQNNAVILFGDATHVLGPFGTYAKQVLHAKTAALVYPNIAGITHGRGGDQATAPDGRRSRSSRSATTRAQTDLIGPLTSAGAQTADMVIPYSDSSGCVNLAKGLKQLGITDTKKIVSAPLCLNGQVICRPAATSRIWTYAIASSLYGDPTDPGMPRLHEAVAKKYSTAGERAGPVEHRHLRPDADHRSSS